MKYGVRNNIKAKVVSVKKGAVMAQVECQMLEAAALQSVITIDSVEDMDLRPGDEIQLLIKAVNVIPVKP